MVKKVLSYRKIKQGIKCYIQEPVREPFISLSVRAIILLITVTVLLGLISYYYDMIDL